VKRFGFRSLKAGGRLLPLRSISQMATLGARSLGFLALCLASSANGPSAEKDNRSATELIGLLAHHDKLGRISGMSGCGPGSADRRAGEALVKLGASALPQLEVAIKSLERHGEASEFSLNARWLLYAYAGIEGGRAYPRLRKIASMPYIGLSQEALDGATADALGLTSYVSRSRFLGRHILCRPEEPRDALERHHPRMGEERPCAPAGQLGARRAHRARVSLARASVELVASGAVARATWTRWGGGLSVRDSDLLGRRRIRPDPFLL
jgi:hypothetical protein